MNRLRRRTVKKARRKTITAPIQPLSVLRLSRLWPHARRRHQLGEIWRVGYYCRHCGVDTIWLADQHGEYTWTVDLPFLQRHFEILVPSSERSVYGKARPKLGPYEGPVHNGTSAA